MTECCETGDALHGYRIRAEAGKVSDPRVIAKSGRHKARRIILTENAEAIIERKLGWISKKADEGPVQVCQGLSAEHLLHQCTQDRPRSFDQLCRINPAAA
jgi:hypothetical protein